ncbi:hypothetical protein PMAYCL1PPCAC_03720, partial [Pristionchus mayeri]
MVILQVRQPRGKKRKQRGKRSKGIPKKKKKVSFAALWGDGVAYDPDYQQGPVRNLLPAFRHDFARGEGEERGEAADAAAAAEQQPATEKASQAGGKTACCPFADSHADAMAEMKRRDEEFLKQLHDFELTKSEWEIVHTRKRELLNQRLEEVEQRREIEGHSQLMEAKQKAEAALKQKTDELQESKEKIRHLECEIRDLQKKMKESEEHIARVVKQCDDMKREGMDELSKELLERDMEALKKDNNRLRELKWQAEQAVEEKTQKIHCLEERDSEMKKLETARGEEMRKAEEEMAALKQRCGKLDVERAVAEVCSEGWEGRFYEMVQVNVNLQVGNANIEAESVRMEKELRQLKKDVSDRDGLIKKMNEELAKCANRVKENMDGVISKFEERKAEWKSVEEDLRGQLSSRDEQMRVVNEELSKRTTTEAELEKQVAQLEQCKAELVARNLRLRAGVETGKEECMKVLEEMREFENSISERDSRIKAMAEECATLKDKCAALEKDLDGTTVQFEGKKSEWKTIEEGLQRTVKEREETIEKEREEARKTQDALNQRIMEVEGETAADKAALKNLIAELTHCKEQLEQVNHKLEECNSGRDEQVKAMTEECATLREKCTALEESLFGITNQFEKKKSSWRSIEEELRRTVREHEEMIEKEREE